jgi:single-strand selective monofunctional uracil DNA glycosylase
MQLVEIAEHLRRDAEQLRFTEPVTHVYNPLQYAWAPYRAYLERYGSAPKQAVLVGMNPGPWGMAQTGVPFGEVSAAREWLGICEPVGRPENEHPKRPVEGFECARSEVSGARLWGWARLRFGTPERFFQRFFVANYCPLVFMEASGRNRTPDKLPAREREALFAVCDQALRVTIEALGPPEWVIGIGAFAGSRAYAALEGLSVRIGRVLHPSPASPLANRGWAEQAEHQLTELGIELPSA